ncbi:MAG: tRNA (guanosine(46)-N7)-methyltransferase TrmB [Pseudomonadales bacterium]|nr:tRNA (guanosine(46)-N7)-methyltransferase TrmB [Pseudomonadales bacterium]
MNEDTPKDQLPSVEQKLRRIRSFVRRQGRMTEGQARALAEYWPNYGLALASDPGVRDTINLSETFNRDAPTILEIGFGNGDSLLAMAAGEREKNFVGIEVHRPGVGALINNAHLQGVNNLRVYCEDAIEVLNRAIGDESLAGVQLFFPDPWHKKRHHKRRIVQPEFAELIANKLQTGGYFHMATDWENYAEHMMDVLSNSMRFYNKAGAGEYSPRPDYRPQTKFEKRGIRLGHGVWDLIFIKK